MDETPTTRDDGPTEVGPPEQAMLPFDASLDEPIPFALTARARRVIAPGTLPELTLLSDDDLPAGTDGADDAPVAGSDPGAQQASFHDVLPADPDDPFDTRQARARALRHAGVDVDQIAGELDVDPLLVRAWVDDITPVRSASRRLRAVPGQPTSSQEQRRRQAARQRRAEQAFEATREAARRAATDRIAADPAFVSGLGLVSGLAEVSPGAVVLTTRDLAVGRAALRWLTATVEVDTSRVRVLLRLAPQVAADLARHAWHEATGLPVERISHTRWGQAPTAESVEAMVRIADPRVAGALAGWRDALLGSFDHDHDGGADVAW